MYKYIYICSFLAEIFSNTWFLGPKQLFTCFYCVCSLYWAEADRNQQWTCQILFNNKQVNNLMDELFVRLAIVYIIRMSLLTNADLIPFLILIS